MASLSDTKQLSELSIPGTHNTMSFHTQQVGNDWVYCQSWGLLLQMLIGIRFFDIRCRNYDDALPIHHGSYYLDVTLNGVLWEVTDYLDDHPKEFFVMNVQEEYSEGGRGSGTETFAQKVDRFTNNYISYIYKGGSSNPTVAEMRGKIVILTQYVSNNFLNWNGFVVENHWNYNENDKITAVKSNLDKARSSSSNTKFLTFISTTKGLSVKVSSNKINPAVHSYVNENSGRLGIIACDYPGPKLIRDITYHN